MLRPQPPGTEGSPHPAGSTHTEKPQERGTERQSQYPGFKGQQAPV